MDTLQFIVGLLFGTGFLVLGVAALIAAFNSSADWLQSLWRWRHDRFYEEIHSLQRRISDVESKVSGIR